MADENKPTKSNSSDGPATPATSTAKPGTALKEKTKPRPPQMLPPWKVLLHNDDTNTHRLRHDQLGDRPGDLAEGLDPDLGRHVLVAVDVDDPAAEGLEVVR